MSDELFRILLDLQMVSDPWPLSPAAEKVFDQALDAEAQVRGFGTAIEAYHHHEPRSL